MRKSSLNTVYASKRLRQFRKHPPACRSSQVRTVLQSQLSAMKFFGLKKKSLGPLRTLIDTKKAKQKILSLTFGQVFAILTHCASTRTWHFFYAEHDKLTIEV